MNKRFWNWVRWMTEVDARQRVFFVAISHSVLGAILKGFVGLVVGAVVGSGMAWIEYKSHHDRVAGGRDDR